MGNSVMCRTISKLRVVRGDANRVQTGAPPPPPPKGGGVVVVHTAQVYKRRCNGLEVVGGGSDDGDRK